ncbi:MAG: aldo/keto reductase [Campylobacterales bacterium]|nr:aldo/keto reductase [Campylobacterales bacterium]
MNLPDIIYGTAWKKEATTRLVVEAVRNGFRAIDTACQPKHYDEKRVGDALATLYKEGIKRDELFLQTKFTPLGGQDPNSIPYDKNAPLDQQVLESFEVSKKNLQTEYLDSYVLHSPLFPFSELLKVWQAMESIYRRGEALNLGISNCYDLEVLQKLYEKSSIKPAFVQNRFYADSDYDKKLRTWCEKEHIQYQSFWSLTANPHILADENILKLTLKYKKSEAQIFFNFLHSLNIIPLSGTTSQIHMKEDVAAFDFTLEKSEYQLIENLL